MIPVVQPVWRPAIDGVGTRRDRHAVQSGVEEVSAMSDHACLIDVSDIDGFSSKVRVRTIRRARSGMAIA
jgi:hypothetical protein